MDENQETHLRQAWTDFQVKNDRTPSSVEWVKWVVEESLEFDHPLMKLSPEVRESIILRAHGEFDASDSRHDEIHRKHRDAEINLNCRRYVDGTF